MERMSTPSVVWQRVSSLSLGPGWLLGWLLWCCYSDGSSWCGAIARSGVLWSRRVWTAG